MGKIKEFQLLAFIDLLNYRITLTFYGKVSIEFLERSNIVI